MANKLDPYFPVLYRGEGNMVAHECLLDLREIQKQTGVTVEDIAKRLMDFGFHAPTISFPLPGTLMIEPTESEDLAEINRFIMSMVAIHHEIIDITSGRVELISSPLKGAPHPWWTLLEWDKPYSAKQACYPLPWVKERKFWPAVARIDNAKGDREFVCACDPIESYVE
ncbi:MAG: hypothetical protein OXC40_07745 [Proteobacteria bacterium]|nr:hypothetical protein [Pseudomonadota bacterium]